MNAGEPLSIALENPPLESLLNWNDIDLVVFDVDGTLYDQRRLHLTMVRRLLAATWRTRSLDTLLTMRTFRKVREALGDRPQADFMRQPLPLLAGCRYPHVDALFAGLRSAGKLIAVFSDYPATDKLAVLGLQAAPVVCAADAAVARLKPDPAGLLAILRHAGVDARRALMIGDRIDCDGVAASRAGMRALIRSSRPHPDYGTFRAYDDPVFRPLLARCAPRVAE